MVSLYSMFVTLPYVLGQTRVCIPYKKKMNQEWIYNLKEIGSVKFVDHVQEQ